MDFLHGLAGIFVFKWYVTGPFIMYITRELQKKLSALNGLLITS